MQKKSKTAVLNPSVALSDIKDSEETGERHLLSFDIADLFPMLPESSHLLIGTGQSDFLATRIAHAVEDADANLINMNVTTLNNAENRHIVSLRVDHRDPGRVARSLERYGYNIIDMCTGDGKSAEDVTRRLDELMHYLSI